MGIEDLKGRAGLQARLGHLGMKLNQFYAGQSGFDNSVIVVESHHAVYVLQKRLPIVRLVLNHIGHVDPLNEADLNALCRLMNTGRVWIKLSPTRVSKRIGTYDDLAALVTKIGQTYETQSIWGSDWPHVMTEPPLPDIPPMLSLLRACLNQQQIWACLWSNPEKLYGF